MEVTMRGRSSFTVFKQQLDGGGVGGGSMCTFRYKGSQKGHNMMENISLETKGRLEEQYTWSQFHT